MAPTTDAPPERGAPLGFIQIPQIGAEFYMVEGVELRWLQEGPGHFPQTPLPGQAGNAALAGHRTTYKAPFNRIDELKPGRSDLHRDPAGQVHLRGAAPTDNDDRWGR